MAGDSSEGMRTSSVLAHRVSGKRHSFSGSKATVPVGKKSIAGEMQKETKSLSKLGARTEEEKADEAVRASSLRFTKRERQSLVSIEVPFWNMKEMLW